MIDSRRNGQGERPGAGALLASVLLHAAAAALLVIVAVGTDTLPYEFEVYQVSIVSPPPAAAGEQTPDAPIEDEAQQDEPEPEPEPEREPPPEPDDTPDPAPVQEEPPQQREPEPTREEPDEPRDEPETEVTRGPDPDEESATAGEGLNVQMDGAEFPFPGYLENIIRQINRYFRWSGAPNLEVEVFFVIQRDGSVADIRVIDGSGNIRFDFQARAAIEQAGIRRAFGELPDEYDGDRLPVQFYFTPSGGGGR